MGIYHIFLSLSINIFIYVVCSCAIRPDVTLVGPLSTIDSFGIQVIKWLSLCNKELLVNIITTHEIDFRHLPPDVADIALSSNKTAGSVAFLFDQVWRTHNAPYLYMPDSAIKIAYSMLESNAIPDQWVSIFNQHFDAVIVPDEYYSSVYKRCGVTKPLFVMPSCIELSDLIIVKNAKKKGRFVFGMSAAFLPHKNHEVLLKAFVRVFGKNKHVHLKLHGRTGDAQKLKQYIAQLKRKNIKNIQLIEQAFTREQYIRFLSSLDCYVLVSKGEGFSVTPREALALGLPCIISDNTAHTTLVRSNYFIPVKALKAEPAYYPSLGQYCGYNFNCSIKDLAMTLKTVYTNYETYKTRAVQGKEWIKGYAFEHMKDYYMAFFKPKKVILGTENSIRPYCLITSSIKLYDKYKALITKA